MEYFDGNINYWNKDGGYDAPNTESWVFRWYGRILRDQLGISGRNSEKLLDFGCGAGAAVNFFHRQGFDVYGVDISEGDITKARQRTPQAAEHLKVVSPTPSEDADYFGVKFDVVVGIQSFYYFNDTDFKKMIRGIYNQMKPGAIIYATMMGTQAWYYGKSTDAGDGLRNVTTGNDRLGLKDYFMQFVRSKEELIEKFSLFEPIRIGYYDAVWMEEEGSEFHYTFTGRKPLQAD